MTRAPAAASIMAVARPMPVAAPVTSAVLPASDNVGGGQCISSPLLATSDWPVMDRASSQARNR